MVVVIGALVRVVPLIVRVSHLRCPLSSAELRWLPDPTPKRQVDLAVAAPGSCLLRTEASSGRPKRRCLTNPDDMRMDYRKRCEKGLGERVSKLGTSPHHHSSSLIHPALTLDRASSLHVVGSPKRAIARRALDLPQGEDALWNECHWTLGARLLPGQCHWSTKTSVQCSIPSGRCKETWQPEALGCKSKKDIKAAA